MKALLLFLIAWALLMAQLLKGDDFERPFPQNIGGEWLHLSGLVESHEKWYVRLAKSTSIYTVSGPPKTGDLQLWGIPHKVEGSYGAGLQWRVRF